VYMHFSRLGLLTAVLPRTALSYADACLWVFLLSTRTLVPYQSLCLCSSSWVLCVMPAPWTFFLSDRYCVFPRNDMVHKAPFGNLSRV
ncbi:hypothetical protein F5148DRAFT_1185803, partial [Russula earlei]